ncbi:type II toxin-antitoxin system RelE/ParE family toxin [Candidatus Burkholderia verschuerenii]|nr:type II toxin-antitoxin system RelE/ParE family toxin [Candidatus Burkholderia verschuerenii]
MTDEPRRVKIRISGEFDARLTEIERYLNRVERPESFRQLVKAIREKVAPMLKRFPAIGRRVFNTKPDTVDALLAMEELMGMARNNGDTLREYLFDDYVLLYWLSEDAITFLSIRHTREVSFEFHDLWGGEP